MPDSSSVYVCPGCGRPVEPGEDYVIAEEYKLQSEFALHLKREGSESVQRRFHVGHFRGRRGDFFYELIADPEERHPPE